MAAIDKIYGDLEQYDEFYIWCSRHLPEAQTCFYPRDGYPPGERVLTQFPDRINRAILRSDDNPPPWVVTRIKEQYGKGLEQLLYGILEV